MRLTRIEGHCMHPVLFVIPLPFTETKILIYSVFFCITVALVLGIYLVHRSVMRIWRQDALINRIKQQDPGLAEFYRGQL